MWYTSRVSIPRNHHYVPAFYLSRWHGKGAKLVEYSRKHGLFLSKSVGAHATCFERDLYTFPDLPPLARQILESEFFNHTDHLASKALQELLSGNNNWNPELRTAWSRFLLNFRVRHPDPFKELRAHISKTWNAIDPEFEAKYATLRKDHHPPTLVEFTASLGPEAGAKIQLRFIHKLLDNERIGQKINEMHWQVIDVSQARHTLLTSDWPADLVMARGMVSLPLSPTLLFYAATEIGHVQQIVGTDPNRLVQLSNTIVTTRARRFVYGHDRSQEAFVKRLMSSDMLPTPLWPSLGNSRRFSSTPQTFQGQQ